MPTVDLIAKIQAVAEDVRGDPAVRAVAFSKLDAFKREYPHLFLKSYKVEDDDNPWADVVNVEDAPMPKTREEARFFDIDNWDVSAKGNPTIVVTVKGVRYRVAVFRYVGSGSV